MAVPAGVGQALDEQDARALAPAGAVGGVGERLAPPVGGQAALARELDERRWRGHHGGAAREREVTLPRPQRLRGPVQGHKRRRARRVHGDRRAFEAEGVGDPAGDHAGGVAGGQVALDGLRRVAQQGGVVLAVGTDEHTGRAAAQGVCVDARALHGLPGGLQQQPLLRVGAQRLARGDTEEGGVEVGDAVEETALGGVTGAEGVGVLVEEGGGVPAPVVGEAAHRVPALCQQLPQRLGRVGAARKTAGHPDHGDGLVGGLGAADLARLAAPEQRHAQVLRGLGAAGVVEHQGGRQRQTGGGDQLVPQFDGGQRVESEFAERGGRRDLVGGGVAEHSGRAGADEVGQASAGLGVAEPGDALAQGVVDRARFGFGCDAGE